MVSCRQPGFPMYAGFLCLEGSSRVQQGLSSPLGSPTYAGIVSLCPSWSLCPSGSNVCRGFPCISGSPVSRVCLVSYVCQHFLHLPIRSHYGLPRETSETDALGFIYSLPQHVASTTSLSVFRSHLNTPI